MMGEEYLFWKVKNYLYRALNASRKTDLLKRRIGLRDVSDPDYEELKKELGAAEEEKARTEIEITDFLSNLPDVSQQLVMVKKYVDGKSWEEISKEMVISVRGVQKLQGKALPVLKEIYDARFPGEGE